MKTLRLLLGAALGATLCWQNAGALEILGAGSSAAAPLYAGWAAQWAEASGHKLSYAPIGSSAGLKAIIEGKADFGASDVALSPEVQARDGLVCFPVAISGVVPIVNLPSVPRGQLRLSGKLLADILVGHVERWNAPEIAALNPGLPLPSLAIKVVAREDGSGTTYGLSHYLSKVSETWAKNMGNDFKLKWAAGVIQAKGTGGMLEAVRKSPGAIGYADYGQVESGKLNYARIANQKGQYPAPGPASFKAALQGSSWATRGAYEEMLSDAPSVSAWPLTSGTFVIMRKKSARSDQASAVLSMFNHAFVKGDGVASEHHWIPLPEGTQARVTREMAKPTNAQGQPLTWDIKF